MQTVYSSKNKINYFEEKVLGNFISSIQNFCGLYLRNEFEILSFKDSSEMPSGNEYSSQIVTFNDARFLVIIALANHNCSDISFDFTTKNISDEILEEILSYTAENIQDGIGLSGTLAIDKELLRQFLTLNNSYRFDIHLTDNYINCFFVSIAQS